eukprot:gene30489-39738_t
MSIFDAYDHEFSSLSQEISRNVSELKAYTSANDKTDSLIKMIDGLLKNSTDVIKQMELEVRGHDPATRKVLTEKITQYKKSSSSQKMDFERAKEQASRSSLLGNKSIEQRQRLLDTNEKVHKQNEMIARSLQTVAETAEVGDEITKELQRNREKIESSRAKAQEFSTITDSARRVLGSMARRDVRQRFLIFFIAGVLIIAISVTIYYTTKKN